MLSGLKFIPRDQVEREPDGSEDESKKERKKSRKKKEKDIRRKKGLQYSSSDDDRLEKIKKGSRKKKWYASDDDLTSGSESESDSDSQYERKRRRRRRKKEKSRHRDSSEDEVRNRSKKKSTSRKEEFSSEESDSSRSDIASGDGRHHKAEKRRQMKDREREDNEVAETSGSLARKEMGLDWMLQSKDPTEKIRVTASDSQPEEARVEEEKKVNPRELNPYFKDNGSGYPEDSEGKATSAKQLLSSSLVGDGGASWRLKALKRAQEQSAREGRNLEEVVEERWGSLSHLAVSVATHKTAPTRAHLHAIKNRRKGMGEDEQRAAKNDCEKGDPRMKVPKLQDSLSWGKRIRKMSSEDSGVVSAALSGLNKFKDDGNFMSQFMQQKTDDSDNHGDSSYIKSGKRVQSNTTPVEYKEASEDVPMEKPALSANQLAAKCMQLRMKGKHEEAENLMKEAEAMKAKQVEDDGSRGPQADGTASRYVKRDMSLRQKKKEDDADLHLAQSIMRNHQYSMSARADEEYDYDEGPRKKKKGRGDDRKTAEVTPYAQRFLTQQERCQFCFENPNRPKHLVIAVANFAYLSLPNWEPVVPGHCCILTLQHESATRSVDDSVWNEIRNFKKCLVMMFAKQEKDVVFLETVMGITQQRRHCLVECIPLPRELAKQAPVYFKKAIDEAEDEWSQHNAKKLIDTSQKGLRGSIPKNFPYFYVEFGLDKGFVHVIDDENVFKSSFGLNVMRGLLRLPAEDMHRRRKYESVDKQKQAVACFVQDWEPFDWTKQLDL